MSPHTAPLHACAASVVLSGYPRGVYDELYRDWHRVGLPAFTGVCGCRVEVLLSNRPLGQQASLFDELETPESLTTG